MRDVGSVLGCPVLAQFVLLLLMHVGLLCTAPTASASAWLTPPGCIHTSKHAPLRQVEGVRPTHATPLPLVVRFGVSLK